MNKISIRCRSSVMSKVGFWASVTLYPLVSALLLCCSLFLVFSALIHPEEIYLLIFAIPDLAISFLMIAFTVCSYRFETRKIVVDQTGVTVKGKNGRTYDWTNIGGMCIVRVGGNANTLIREDEICIFLTHFKREDINKMYNNYFYIVFHLKDFVLLDYSPTLVDTLSQYSGLEITDQRFGPI